MNENENQQDDNEQQDGAQELTPQVAATGSNRSNLNEYQKWQQANAHLLMDGTASQQSYIKVAENDTIEYGVQPRILPGVVKAPDGSKELGLVAFFRVRVAFKKLLDSEPEDASNEVAQLKAFLDPQNTWKWYRTSAQRISRPVEIGIPLNPTKPGALQQMLALLEFNLFDKLLSTMPTPAQGWDTAMIRAARAAWSSYLYVSINQFGLFQNNGEAAKWDENTTAGELTPELVQWLGALGSMTEQDPADEEQDD